MAALQPDALTTIVRDALQAFFDFSLAARIIAAGQQWRDDANARLLADPRYAAAYAVVGALHKVVAAAVETLNQAQDNAHDRLWEITPPEFELPEPEITADPPKPLFDSKDDWAAAIRKLIEHKDGNPEPTVTSNPIIYRRPSR